MLHVEPGQFVDIDPKKGEYLQMLQLPEIVDGTGMDSPEAWLAGPRFKEFGYYYFGHYGDGTIIRGGAHIPHTRTKPFDWYRITSGVIEWICERCGKHGFSDRTDDLPDGWDDTGGNGWCDECVKQHEEDERGPQ